MSLIKDLYRDEIRNGWFINADKKKFWNRELEIWQMLDKICHKHKITYWANYGTLIGAARHGGFIPWDWDMDFSMMRPEFDRFEKIIGEELINNGGIFELDYKDCSMIKIVHSQTTLTNRHNRNKKNLQGIAIDIFALDADSDGTQDGFLASSALNEILGAIFNYPFILKHVKEGGLTVNDFSVLEIIANKMTSEEKWNFLRLSASALFNQSSSVSWIGDLARKSYKYPMQKGWFRETVYLPFELVELPVPIDYDEVLKSYYGDWHKFVNDGHSDVNVIHSADIPYREFFQYANLDFMFPEKNNHL